MRKVLNILRVSGFVITALTSVPLMINYFANRQPEHELVIHLHVLFGAIFIITAIPAMIFHRKELKG
jgi:hypothetical protein